MNKLNEILDGPGSDEAADSESSDSSQEDSHPDWSYEEASDYYQDNGF